MKRFNALKDLKTIRDILPCLLVLLTGKNRYIPNIEWSDSSWTHNVFRVFEMFFGRREGIRLEVMSTFDGHNTITQAFTFEGTCALIESSIRNVFKFKLVRVYIPVLALNTGFSGLPSHQPYMFAIAFDAVSSLGEGTSSNPHNFSHTCTGSNRILVVGGAETGIGIPASATYNSVSMVNQTASNTSIFARMFSLIAPTTGTNTVSVNSGGSSGSFSISIVASSYTGVNQASTGVGATNTATAASTVNITSTVANSYIVDFIGCGNSGNSITVGSGQTLNATVTEVTPNPCKAGSSYRPTTSVGSYTMFWNGVTAGSSDLHCIEILPLASGPTNLKSYNTNLAANIKSIDTNLIANVKSLNTNV